jgi:hypothetical protein
MTEQEKKEHYTHKLVTSVMTAQILQNQLHELVVGKIFQQKDKQHIKNAIKVLESIEVKYYDKFYDKKEEETSEVYDFYEKFIQTISNVPIYDASVVLMLYKLYKDTPKKLQDLINDNYESEYLKKLQE